MTALLPFAQFAKPMTATLADLRELTRFLSAFAAFQGHFASPFAAINSSSKLIILPAYGEPTLRNLARLLRSRFRRPATNPKLSILLLFFCQRPLLLYPYQNLSPLTQPRGLNRGFHKTMS